MADDAIAAQEELSATTATEIAPTVAADAQPSARDDGTPDTDPAIGVDYPEDAEADAKPRRTPKSNLTLATLAGLVIVATLAGLAGWLGVKAHQAHQATERNDEYLQVGRQGAVNLTTIDYAEVDTDVERILGSATGAFYDDFSKRSPSFVSVVKQVQSKSVGTVTEAGLESATDDDAQVLVAVTVKTASAGAPEQEPRLWRMRIIVHRSGDQTKVSNVEFVP